MKWKFILLNSLLLFSQENKAQLLLNQITPSKNTVTHTQSIKMVPGFKVTAEQNAFFRAYIDSDNNGVPDHYDINRYSSFTWAQNVNTILNSHCNTGILIIEQKSFHPLLETEVCFNYDMSGNYNTMNDCTIDMKTYSLQAAQKPTDNRDILSNHIKVYPVPTTSIVTISWNSEVSELISHIKLTALNGGYLIDIPVNSFDYRSEVDLTYQPNGIYYLIITLKSGKSFSKSIIKL